MPWSISFPRKRETTLSKWENGRTKKEWIVSLKYDRHKADMYSNEWWLCTAHFVLAYLFLGIDWLKPCEFAYAVYITSRSPAATITVSAYLSFKSVVDIYCASPPSPLLALSRSAVHICIPVPLITTGFIELTERFLSLIKAVFFLAFEWCKQQLYGLLWHWSLCFKMANMHCFCCASSFLCLFFFCVLQFSLVASKCCSSNNLYR